MGLFGAALGGAARGIMPGGGQGGTLQDFIARGQQPQQPGGPFGALIAQRHPELFGGQQGAPVAPPMTPPGQLPDAGQLPVAPVDPNMGQGIQPMDGRSVGGMIPPMNPGNQILPPQGAYQPYGQPQQQQQPFQRPQPRQWSSSFRGY